MSVLRDEMCVRHAMRCAMCDVRCAMCDVRCAVCDVGCLLGDNPPRANAPARDAVCEQRCHEPRSSIHPV
eukprot:239999-Rhodomonas_salina.3